MSFGRFVALFALFLSSSSAQIAAAAEAADSNTPTLPPPLQDQSFGSNLLSYLQDAVDGWTAGDDDQHPIYEPEFNAFGRSILGRAAAGTTGLANNVASQLNVVAGETQTFVFEKTTIFSRDLAAFDDAEQLELRRREGEDEDEEATDGLDKRATTSSKKIFLSANSCMQPQPVANASGTATAAQAPQLTMYVSTTSSNTSPGPNSNSSGQTVHVFTEGAVMFSMNATEDVYIGIAAPNISSTELTGDYNVEVAASVDGWYHSFDNDSDANLVWVDSDGSAALLITHNLTRSTDEETDEEIMSRMPYVMFAQNENDTSIDGMRFSYCGLSTYAQIAATNDGKHTSMVTTGMTRTGLGNLPKQQFYFSGLNSSSKYLGILAALPSNGSDSIGDAVVGGGGRISKATSFQTQGTNGNCQVVFNLTFCNETAYAVPSNPNSFANASVLAQVYDEYASGIYDNFKKNLAQIPCEAPSTQQYSLARTCDDCLDAYKNWLCSVVMPRCADFSENEEYLQPRAISQPFPDGSSLNASELALYPNISAYNSSRNPFIDETIAPGPYKEVLPCDDVCYNLVQSCPSDLGFSCPLPGNIGFNTSYGKRTDADQNGAVTCNYPGSAHFFSAGPPAPRVPWGWLLLAAFSGAIALLI